MSRPKVLFLAHLVPWPLEGGGQIKSYHVLKALSGIYDVTTLALYRTESEREHVGPLEPLCSGGIELIRLPRGKLRDLSIAASTLLSGRSFLIRRDDVPAMHEAVGRRLASERYSAIHLDHLQMASYVPDETHGAAFVLDQHNVEHRIPQRIARTPGGLSTLPMRAFAALEWPRMRDFEREAVRRADRTLAVSDEDRQSLQVLAGANPDTIRTIPIGVDTAHFGEVDWSPGGTALVSIGTMYWPPNVDAMLYFFTGISSRK